MTKFKKNKSLVPATQGKEFKKNKTWFLLHRERKGSYFRQRKQEVENVQGASTDRKQHWEFDNVQRYDHSDKSFASVTGNLHHHPHPWG